MRLPPLAVKKFICTGLALTTEIKVLNPLTPGPHLHPLSFLIHLFPLDRLPTYQLLLIQPFPHLGPLSLTSWFSLDFINTALPSLKFHLSFEEEVGLGTSLNVPRNNYS